MVGTKKSQENKSRMTQKHTRKAKKDGHKATGPGEQGPACFEELLEQTRITIAEDSRSGVSDLTSRAAS